MKRIAALLVLVSAGLFTIAGCEKPKDKPKTPETPAPAPMGDTPPPAEAPKT